MLTRISPAEAPVFIKFCSVSAAKQSINIPTPHTGAAPRIETTYPQEDDDGFESLANTTYSSSRNPICFLSHLPHSFGWPGGDGKRIRVWHESSILEYPACRAGENSREPWLEDLPFRSRWKMELNRSKWVPPAKTFLHFSVGLVFKIVDWKVVDSQFQETYSRRKGS